MKCIENHGHNSLSKSNAECPVAWAPMNWWILSLDLNRRSEVLLLCCSPWWPDSSVTRGSDPGCERPCRRVMWAVCDSGASGAAAAEWTAGWSSRDDAGCWVLHSRDAVEAVLAGGDVQRRVSVDVGGLQVAASIQEQFGDVGAARERRPVKADVLFLRERARRNGDTLVLEWVSQVSELYCCSSFTLLSFTVTATRKSLRVYPASAHLVPDADVGPFGQQQLHLVHVLVLRRPDDGRPSAVILGPKKERERELH